MLDWNRVLDFAAKGNPEPDTRVEKSDAEWRSLLTPDQYHIAREHGTERSFSGEFCSSYDSGRYSCVCCGTALFDSTIKFDSNTGWPSITQPIKENAIEYKGNPILKQFKIGFLFWRF